MYMGHSCLFLYKSYNSWLKTGHFRYYTAAALDTSPPPPGIVVLFAYLFVYLFGDLALVVPAWSKVSGGEVCTQSWIRRVCKRVSQRLIILTKI